MDYTAKMPKPHEVLIKALHVCYKSDGSIEGCEDCPYERGYQPCTSLPREAADMIEQQARKIAELEKEKKWMQ